jgi:hypothetical protein
MKNYRTFFHVPITYIPLSSSLMKYLTLPFPWYVRTQGVLLHFCFSLYWSKLLLDMLWALLKLFLIILCFVHSSIKFTHEISNTTISVLDISSSLSEGELFTDLYSKPTDTNQYLLPSRCHPPHVTQSVSIVTKQSVGGILTERDSQISLQASMPSEWGILV